MFCASSLAAQLPSNSDVAQSQREQESYNENRQPQQTEEKNAVILKQGKEASDDGNYHFGFETSSGLRVEEAGNPTNAQGGFSYKGDDGKTYTMTYTAGEDGFRPQGEHIPVPPPVPEAILEALKKNEQDEAVGIFDDGKYHPEKDLPTQTKPGSTLFRDVPQPVSQLLG